MRADISTDRFHLRELTADDVTQRYLQWFRNADAKKFIAASASTQELSDLRDYVLTRIGRPDILFLGIFDKANGAHIGNIKYEPVDRVAGVAVMGILIGDASYRGKRVATEVLRATAFWLEANCGITKVALTVHAGNISAIRAYRAVGYKVAQSPHTARRDADAISMVLSL